MTPLPNSTDQIWIRLRNFLKPFWKSSRRKGSSGMIERSRLIELNDIMSRSAQTVPAALWAFHQGCKSAGFTANEALQLTLGYMASVLAIPSEAELPKTPSTQA